MFESLRSCLAGARRSGGCRAVVGVAGGELPPSHSRLSPLSLRQPRTPPAGKRIWCCRISARWSFNGINGRTLLMAGLVVCVLGLAFGMVIFVRLRNLPVHRSMHEISELIYETCKTYLITQGQVHPDPVGVHRHHQRHLLRRARRER